MLIDAYNGWIEPPDLDSIIELYGADIGLHDYPIWNENMREWLNNRIIEHFRYRRVSADTSSQFIYYLNRTMIERMPTINPIFYELEKAAQDKTWLQYLTGDTCTVTSSGNNEGTQVYSTSPQNRMYGEGGENYMDNLTETSGNSTNTSTNNAEHYGRSNMVSTSLNEWLTGINNALQVVFYYLESCFLQTY